MVSLLRYFLCLITVIPSMTVAAEAARGGWRGVVVTSLYDGWYGYPIRLTRITATPQTIVTVTDIRTPMAPMFTATRTPPFVVFGVCEPTGLQGRPRPELHLHPRKRCR